LIKESKVCGFGASLPSFKALYTPFAASSVAPNAIPETLPWKYNLQASYVK
jgi:hypothetical protein